MLDKHAAAKASIHLSDYSLQKGIYMKINYFNADHTHALFDLPTSKSIEQVVQLFKGDSSHWINENKLIKGKFAWGRGMGPSPFLTLMCRGWQPILRARKSTIRKGPLRKSMISSSNGTAVNETQKPCYLNLPKYQRSLIPQRRSRKPQTQKAQATSVGRTTRACSRKAITSLARLPV